MLGGDSGALERGARVRRFLLLKAPSFRKSDEHFLCARPRGGSQLPEATVLMETGDSRTSVNRLEIGNERTSCPIGRETHLQHVKSREQERVRRWLGAEVGQAS